MVLYYWSKQIDGTMGLIWYHCDDVIIWIHSGNYCKWWLGTEWTRFEKQCLWSRSLIQSHKAISLAIKNPGGIMRCWSAFWLLMAWCLSTRPSATTILTQYQLYLNINEKWVLLMLTNLISATHWQVNVWILWRSITWKSRDMKLYF